MHTGIEVIAHRGASAHAAEHTFAAYDLAIRMGADALELDVRMTADGRLVVLHDPTLARTAGDPRAVADVRERDLPARGGPLRLEAVLDRYGRDTGWLIELKDPSPRMEAALVTALRERRLTACATVQSFDHASLRRLRRAADGIAVAPLICESTRPGAIPALLRRAARYAAAAGVLHTSITPATVQAARALGLGLRAYTVNHEPDMARLLAAGVDGLITDRPELARAVAGRALAQPLAA